MKLINKYSVDNHNQIIEKMKSDFEATLALVEQKAPQAIEFTQNPDGEAPKVLSNGATVMAGDWYHDSDGNVVVVANSDIGDNGAWQSA